MKQRDYNTVNMMEQTVLDAINSRAVNMAKSDRAAEAKMLGTWATTLAAEITTRIRKEWRMIHRASSQRTLPE